jgi:peptide-methionine (S)-S-oxide reductase
MTRLSLRFVVAFAVAAALGCSVASSTTDSPGAEIPDPALDAPLAAGKGEQTAILAGGCFWGIEAVFQHVRGVIDAESGYCGGSEKSANYEEVSSGATRHAESVRVKYDPSQISYGQLLKVFFSVAHDPTELNRQGPDIGTQYRSAIFYTGDEQKRIAEAYINQLNELKVFKRKIVTEVSGGKTFYEAEAYHQDYVARHPDQPYVAMHDIPKLTNLKKKFPNLYTAR